MTREMGEQRVQGYGTLAGGWNAAWRADIAQRNYGFLNQIIRINRCVRIFVVTQLSVQCVWLLVAVVVIKHVIPDDNTLVTGVSENDYPCTVAGYFSLSHADEDFRNLEGSLDSIGYKVSSVVDEKSECQDIVTSFMRLCEITNHNDSLLNQLNQNISLSLWTLLQTDALV